jgi:hypothetical protein
MALGNAVVTVASTSIGSDLATLGSPGTTIKQLTNRTWYCNQWVRTRTPADQVCRKRYYLTPVCQSATIALQFECDSLVYLRLDFGCHGHHSRPFWVFAISR